MHIPKTSKKEKRLVYASLNQRESKEKEIQEGTKKGIENCIRVWRSRTNFIEEFDLPGFKPLREVIPRSMSQQQTKDNTTEDVKAISGTKVWTQQTFYKFIQFPFEQIKLISEFEIKD